MTDNLFEQITNISKAHAYDIVIEQCKEQDLKIKALEESISKAKARVKYLEDLINEYSTKMTVNLSGGKVDEFLKDQIKDSDTENEITQEMKDHDDLKNINI